MEWHRKAAEQGHARAQLSKGDPCRMYEYGLGDVKWCRNAAEQGYADAQFRLGAMYEKGLR